MNQQLGSNLFDTDVEEFTKYDKNDVKNDDENNDEKDDEIEDEKNKYREALIKNSNDLEEYIDICRQIKEVKDELKIFTERKFELEIQIRKFMENYSIPEFITADGKSKVKITETKQKLPLNKEYFRQVIGDKIQNNDLLQELETLTFNRPVNVTCKIKLATNNK